MADFEPTVYIETVASGLLASLPPASWISTLMLPLPFATTRFLPAPRVHEAR
jgi:hypothetical protein